MRLIPLFLFISCTLFSAPPKVIVFDYGGVVAKVDRRPMLEFLSASLQISYKHVRRDFASDKLYAALEKDLAFWEDYTGKKLSEEWFDSLTEKKKQIVANMPGMQPLIQKLKEKGFRVAVLSNTKFHRARFIERMGGYDLFDPILLSCHLGVKKPQPKIFRILLRSLDKAPEDCLFIDNRQSNVEAANKIGLRTIHFTTIDNLLPQLMKHEVTFE